MSWNKAAAKGFIGHVSRLTLILAVIGIIIVAAVYHAVDVSLVVVVGLAVCIAVVVSYFGVSLARR